MTLHEKEAALHDPHKDELACVIGGKSGSEGDCKSVSNSQVQQFVDAFRSMHSHENM